MKYVVFKVKPKSVTRSPIEFGVIFPEFLIHRSLSDSIVRQLKLCEGCDAEPIAAGFCAHLHDGMTLFCNGMSESLELRSRGDVDVQVLRKHLPMGIL